jgi:hypothetical protein
MNVRINRGLSIVLLCCLSVSALCLPSALQTEKLKTKKCMGQWPISDKKYEKLLNNIDWCMWGLVVWQKHKGLELGIYPSYDHLHQSYSETDGSIATVCFI